MEEVQQAVAGVSDIVSDINSIRLGRFSAKKNAFVIEFFHSYNIEEDGKEYNYYLYLLPRTLCTKYEYVPFQGSRGSNVMKATVVKVLRKLYQDEEYCCSKILSSRRKKKKLDRWEILLS